ncbi:DUF190 domain-containing protein [Lolliginicoccus levis]|uniref:DUF190 domain-containing protein n=1 Tax=Lolliginicoccus levis TaxID=2919542 RepID=UPI00241E3F6C|nr:DUF190 domain-containing protein [Lolliginicoccus levis]
MDGATGFARLMILTGENDTWKHRPLYSEIVHRAHAAGLRGASVLRGVEGFGATSLVHTARLLSLSEDLPMVVMLVDAEAALREFVDALGGMIEDRLVTIEPVELLRPRADGQQPRR